VKDGGLAQTRRLVATAWRGGKKHQYAERETKAGSRETNHGPEEGRRLGENSKKQFVFARGKREGLGSKYSGRGVVGDITSKQAAYTFFMLRLPKSS